MKRDNLMIFTEKEVRTAFRGGTIGREIVFYESTVSTMELAFELSRQHDNPDGIVVVADSQTGGKGRFGRKWTSPPGVNLYFTVLLKPELLPKDVSLITLAAAVAVARAIREYSGLNAEIKWPNDIMINNKKTGGILTEMKALSGRIDVLAVGVGVNVNMTRDMMGTEIKDSATSLRMEKGEVLNRLGLFREILSGLDKYYKILLNGDKGALINEWLSLNSTIGNSVLIKNQDTVLTGIAEGISDEGELVLRLASGNTKLISAGDVTIIKKKESKGPTP